MNSLDKCSHAALGQPGKIVNLGPKLIYVYKKVTFLRGKGWTCSLRSQSFDRATGPPANLLPRALLALQVAPAWAFASFGLTSSINQQKAKETPFSILLADNSRPTQDVK